MGNDSLATLVREKTKEIPLLPFFEEVDAPTASCIVLVGPQNRNFMSVYGALEVRGREKEKEKEGGGSGGECEVNTPTIITHFHRNIPWRTSSS